MVGSFFFGGVLSIRFKTSSSLQSVSVMEESTWENEYAPFCVAYVRAICAWNNAEHSARDILTSLSEGGVGATIAIHQLGNVSLVDALKTVAKFIRSIGNPLGDLQADHVEHFVEGLDRLRVYRNFYVHDIRGVGREPGSGKIIAQIYGVDVKGGYSLISETLRMAELSKFTRHCFDLETYGSAIAGNVTRSALKQYVTPKPEPLASLQKPQWPDRLKKSRESLIKQPPPPPPSRG